jgi:outer membrane immunogenic protein
MMKKLLLAGIAFAAVAGPAAAADLPVYKQPVVVAPPVYTWTGLYVGGNVGYSWGDARTDSAGSGTTFAFPMLQGGFPSSIGLAESNAARPNGAVGGVQVGYNFQVRPHWILGFEADVQGSGQRGSHTSATPFSTQICNGAAAGPPPMCVHTDPLSGAVVTGYEAKIGWFGTIRGRAGVLIDDVLVYGTCGLAYGHVGLSGNATVNGSTPANPSPLCCS